MASNFYINQKIVDFCSEHSLPLSEELVLGRVANFRNNTYFESTDTCSRTTGLSIRSIKTAKKNLVELGAIIVSGRKKSGIIYKLADFLCDTYDTIEDSKEENDMVTVVPSKSETNRSQNKSFNKRYKNYQKSWDIGEDYIERNFIQRKDIKKCQKEFAGVVDVCARQIRANHPNESEKEIADRVYNSIEAYINYLDSDTYKNDPFSPQIAYSYDLWGKFAQIRNKKRNNELKAKQYDPNKDLTTYGGEY